MNQLGKATSYKHAADWLLQWRCWRLFESRPVTVWLKMNPITWWTWEKAEDTGKSANRSFKSTTKSSLYPPLYIHQPLASSVNSKLRTDGVQNISCPKNQLGFPNKKLQRVVAILEPVCRLGIQQYLLCMGKLLILTGMLVERSWPWRGSADRIFSILWLLHRISSIRWGPKANRSEILDMHCTSSFLSC